MKPQKFDLIIIGGGMVGASLAASLLPTAKALDLSIAMIEANPLPEGDLTVYQPSYDSRATALSYGSRCLYEQIGIWDAISAHVTPIHHIHVSDKGHFGATRLHAEEEGVSALGYVVENHWLGRTLLHHLQQHENREHLTVLCPANVTQVSHSDQDVSQVTVEIAGSEPLELTTELVVMADGGRSTLREQLGIGYQQTEYDQHAVVAVISSDEPHQQVAYERFTDQGPVALLPLLDQDGFHRCGLVWTVPDDELDETLAMSDEAFMTRVQARFGHRCGRFIKVGPRYHYPLKRVLADEQVRSGLVVLGNAAHALHPIAGQGYNLALRGVMDLAEHVIRAREADAPLGELSALQAYYQKRVSDQQRTIGLSDKIMRLFSNSHPLLGLGRSIGLQVMDVCPSVKTLFARGAMGLDIPAPNLALTPTKQTQSGQ